MDQNKFPFIAPLDTEIKVDLIAESQNSISLTSICRQCEVPTIKRFRGICGHIYCQKCVDPARSKCNYCLTNTANQPGINYQFESIPESKNLFSCPYCLLTFEEEMQQKQHKQSHILKNQQMQQMAQAYQYFQNQ